MANSCGIIGSNCNSASHPTCQLPFSDNSMCVVLSIPLREILVNKKKRLDSNTKVLNLGVQLQKLCARKLNRGENIFIKKMSFCGCLTEISGHTLLGLHQWLPC